MEQIKLDKFDIKSIGIHNVLIIGKRATGKTTLITDILNNSEISHGLLFNPTMEYKPEEYSNVKTINLDKNIEYNKQILENAIKLLMLTKCYGDRSSICVVLDNAINEDIEHDLVIKEAFVNNISLKMKNIISIPFLYKLNKEMKLFTDVVFILRESNIDNRKRLFNEYGSTFSSFDHFCQVLDEYTENYGCMVIKRITNFDTVQEKVFWYKVNV